MVGKISEILKQLPKVSKKYSFFLLSFLGIILSFFFRCAFSSLFYMNLISVSVKPSLCRTWSETPKTGFLMTQLNYFTRSQINTGLPAMVNGMLVPLVRRQG